MDNAQLTIKKSGFTLIELLVTISIIAILSTIGLIAYQGIQSKARDSIRKSDLNKIAIALELYLQQNGKYVGTPQSDGSCLSANQIYTDSGFARYINGSVPRDPLYTVLNDPATKQPYLYTAENKCQSFRLFAKLENCIASGDNLCSSTDYNYSIYSDNLTTLADASGNIITPASSSSPASTSTTTPASTSQPISPVAWWKFDETSGTTASDSSGNGNTGRLINNPAWTIGHTAGALSFFNSLNDYVNAGQGASLDLTGSFTITAWIYPRSFGTSSRARIFDKTNAVSGYGLMLDNINSADMSGFCLVNQTYCYGQNPNSISLNTWQHIAVSFNSSTSFATFYVNGILKSSISYPSPLSGSAYFIIGNRIGNDRQFDGLIDELQIYNGALSGTQIQQIYNGSLASSPAPFQCNSGLVSNGCFENQLLGWTCHNSGACSLDSSLSDIHTGLDSVEIISNNSNYISQLTQHVTLPSAGQQYCLSAWAKSQNSSPAFPPNPATLHIGVSLTGSFNGNYTSPSQATFGSSNDWQLIKNTVSLANNDPTSATVFLSVQSYSGSSGAYELFDDISLVSGACP